MRTVGLGSGVHAPMIAHLTGSRQGRSHLGRLAITGAHLATSAGGERWPRFSSMDVVMRGRARYMARACGTAVASGLWQGWLEFVDVDTGDAVRSPRETTQPNRTDTILGDRADRRLPEGALQRALHRRSAPVAPAATPAFDGPAPDLLRAAGPDSILNPFSVYRKGEALLRRQLAAFSVWHLVNIVRDQVERSARGDAERHARRRSHRADCGRGPGTQRGSGRPLT